MRRILATSTLLSSLDSSRSGFCQHARGRRHCPNPHPRQLRCYAAGPRQLRLPRYSRGYSIDAIPADAQVGLAVTINEKGEPENIQVTKSFSKFWDARVVDTVREFHFKPATVDNQPMPVDMNLTINIAR